MAVITAIVAIAACEPAGAVARSDAPSGSVPPYTSPSVRQRRELCGARGVVLFEDTFNGFRCVCAGGDGGAS